MSTRCADSCFRRWSFFLTVVFLVHHAALGQGSYTAQVRGTVTDPAHAVLNNAKVTVTNESTSIATTATTNASGEYVVNGLRPASYAIKVEAPGFRGVVRTGLVLAVSQQATVDFTLSLATTSETVTVTETAPLLDTGTSSLAEDPASGRGKAGRNLSWLRHFLHPETERQATEVDRYGSGVWFERRSLSAELATVPTKVLEEWAARDFPMPDQDFRCQGVDADGSL